MTIRTVLYTLSASFLVAACGGPGQDAAVPQAEPAGETSKDIGEHVVHFSAQRTDALSSEIAKTYSIRRSNDRAMLNVSVIGEADSKSVPADVSVKTVNLTGQLKNVKMRRIDEGDAIYYIGEVDFANRETLIFDISVTPEGGSQASDVRFKRQFFTD